MNTAPHEYTEIIDISLPLTQGTVVYPGNPELTIEEKQGATSTHSLIQMGSHTGTHVDAPKHAFVGGKGLEAFSSAQFVGPVRVLDCTHVSEKVTATDISGAHVQKGERILLKTKNSARGFTEWYDDYVYLDGDAADLLAEIAVALVGIDALSIKKRGGSDLRPHTALLTANIPILEGIDLSQVSPGAYTLACLPLKFTGTDGAPARAVLFR